MTLATVMGDGGMSISYEKYFDEKFEAVNQKVESVSDEVKTLADQLANMPCNDHNEKLTKFEQRLNNGDKFGEKVAEGKHKKTMERFSLWKVLISAIGLAIVILEIFRATGVTK